MSFISFSNDNNTTTTQQSSQLCSSSNNSSGSNTRRGSLLQDPGPNLASGEWTARTEVYDSSNDPFGDQTSATSNQQQDENGGIVPPEQLQPLIDPFGSSQTRTVIRKLGLKRYHHNNNPNGNGSSNSESKVKLDRVCGLTVSNNASLDCDLYSGTIVYTSGCVLVLYNQRKNKQFHIINSLKKPITACKFSKDGRYIVTGECGHQPHGRVWEVSSGEQVASLSGHKYGINCVAFSPDGKYVISVGSQHDMMVNVWDWRSNHIVASNKVSVKVKSISFSEDGDYFVTVGNRHVKFWYLEYNDIVCKNKFESLPLMGRNAILGDQRNNYFCDVACGRGDSKESTYAITKSGLLCEFNNRRLLNKWVELKTESANCVTISQNYICVGCAQGTIRCFRPQSLEFVCTLPRPHTLGIDIAKGFSTRNEMSSISKISSNVKPKYADTVAVVYDEYNENVTAVYSDRSLYFWNMNDIRRIAKVDSFLYHSSCIWDIDIYPFSSKNPRNLLPPGTFLTCSSDDTIRIWNTELDSNSSKASNYIYKKNFFSSELMKILYMDPDLTYLCDPDLIHSRNSSNGNAIQNSDQSDSKNGIRAIKFSTDGKHLASGDRCGNIRIFDLEMQKDLFKIEAHDGEVLCLEYSNEKTCGRSLLVSASRDRFIHIYDVHRQYSCIQNIDDHSSSITSVKFVCSKHDPMNLLLISCGADKSLIFRKQVDPDSDFRLEHHVAGKSTYFDMAVDQKKNQIITASLDRMIRTYDVKTGKNLSSFKGSLGDDGAIIKIAFDPSATFIATSCTDKSIYIYDYQTGECLAATSGHSEIVTGLKFSMDGRHLISISGDGCIFVWRLPVEMTNAIASKLGLPLISDSCHSTTITNRSLNIPLQQSLSNNDESPYRLNTATLPSWARKQMFEDNRIKVNEMNDSKEFSKTLPRGRWARASEGADVIVNTGLVKTYANTFESMASRSSPSTPSGAYAPNMKDTILKNNRLSLILPKEPRTKSSMSSGVEDDDDDRNTTDSDNTYSHDSSYKVNKVDRPNRTKHLMENYSMVSSISMANINDLPFDDDDGPANEGKSKDDKNRYNSLYMSTENLERIDQRSRYLKNAFENIDKSNIENNNSASDDSGINQIDHSLSSTTTASGTVAGSNHPSRSSPSSPPQPHARQSLSSKYNKSPGDVSPPTGNHHETPSNDATDLNQTHNFSTKIASSNNNDNDSAKLDTIKEAMSITSINSKEDNIAGLSSSKMDPKTSITTPLDSTTPTTSVSLSTTTNNIPSSVTTMANSDTESSTSTLIPSTSQPSKKREELTRTLFDAKKRLESVGSLAKHSKSVSNLRTSTLFSSGPEAGVPITSPSSTAAGHHNNHRRHHRVVGSTKSAAIGVEDEDEDDENSYHSLSIDAFRKSISLSDLSSRSSLTLPRKLSVYRNNTQQQTNNTSTSTASGTSMNNYQFAPLWDQRQRVGPPPGAPGSGSLSRTPSSNTLNKVDMMRSQSTLCRQGLWNAAGAGAGGVTATPNGVMVNNQPPGPTVVMAHPVNPATAHLKPPMHANGPAGTPVMSSIVINPRSGRSSAPPSQFRKSAATVSCASSSRRGDSTEDDEELDGSAINSDDDGSDEHRTMRPRPVTPPKPNILKQIRRGSNSANANQMMNGNAGAMPNATPINQYPSAHPQAHHYIQNPHQPLTQSARPRRLWSGQDTMRSSKSEFNLASIGRDTPIRRRNNSGITPAMAANIWPSNHPASMVANDRLDLYMTNPSSIPLSLELCQHLVNEMNFLTNYASRIHERASYSDNIAIVDYLKETLGQVSRDIQAIVGRSNKSNSNNNCNDNNNIPIATSTSSFNDHLNSNGDNNNNIRQLNDSNDPQIKLFKQFLSFMESQNNQNQQQQAQSVTNGSLSSAASSPITTTMATTNSSSSSATRTGNNSHVPTITSISNNSNSQ